MKRSFLAFVILIFGFQHATLASETTTQPTISAL